MDGLPTFIVSPGIIKIAKLTQQPARPLMLQDRTKRFRVML